MGLPNEDDNSDLGSLELLSDMRMEWGRLFCCLWRAACLFASMAANCSSVNGTCIYAEECVEMLPYR